MRDGLFRSLPHQLSACIYCQQQEWRETEAFSPNGWHLIAAGRTESNLNCVSGQWGGQTPNKQEEGMEGQDHGGKHSGGAARAMS